MLPNSNESEFENRIMELKWARLQDNLRGVVVVV